MHKKPDPLLVAVGQKRTEVLIEYEEVVLITKGTNRPQLMWCLGCQREVTMITPQQAALLAKVSVRTMNRRVEADTIHFVETENGQLLICLNSL